MYKQVIEVTIVLKRYLLLPISAMGDVAVLLYGNSQTGDSMESGDGVDISPTDFDKVQFGGDVRYSKGDNEIGFRLSLY